MKKYNMGKKIEYQHVKEDFEKKDYTLVSKEYIGIKSKLDYICNKHKELGVQSITYDNFKKSQNNCTQCKYENNVIIRKNQNHPRQIDINYEKIFKKYEEKIFSLVGKEYTLNKITKDDNGNTMLNLNHTLCGNEYIVNQNNFFNNNCRCQNSNCKAKRLYYKNRKTCEKPFNNLKQQIYDLVKDEYTVSGQYLSNYKKVNFIHNTCGNKFNATPYNFIHKGTRCPICSRLMQQKHITKSQEQFELDVINTHGEEYEVLGEYINCTTRILMKHKLCGNTWYVYPTSFIHGLTRCPKCSSISKGEEKIVKILKNNNINFVSQKSFDGLIGVNGGLLTYDFYLQKYNLLIEYQGRQHEQPIDHFGGETRFNIQQEHDKRKREYAKVHNIDLLEIWYYDFDSIENIINNYLEKIKLKIA